ncbi:MAG: hypothetical protein CBC86_0002275 [Deltaproteobacteria bacterium TMED126]|nr:hypothetical protein [Candidatus Dadabacteria bacterium]NSW97425.1 hypothetical protein [Deltaproteobacteria bacterium TMED126]
MVLKKFIESLSDKYLNSYTEGFNYSTDYELIIKLILSPRASEHKVEFLGNLIVSSYKDYKSLAMAPLDDIENIIRPVGFFNQKAIRLKRAAFYISSTLDNKIPNTTYELMKIPGIGVKSARKYLSLRSNTEEIIIDTHFKRVLKRLNFISSNSKNSEIENWFKGLISKNIHSRSSNLISYFGKKICLNNKPKCDLCQYKRFCNFFSSVHNR